VGVRHSHLDNAGYSIDQTAAKKPLTPEEMVDAIIAEDDARGVYNSLIGCLFARGVYTPDKIVEALGSVGIEKTKEDLEILGRKIFEEKYRFKVREGFDLKKLRVPARFYETVSTVGMVDPDTIETMMKIYRERRGWD
jgi:aldehyde:ferredoxin oxidoreductase